MKIITKKKIKINKKRNINNNSKFNFPNLNIISEEESNRKMVANNEEEKKEDENEYSELDIFNKISKRSQDDFGIGLDGGWESKKSLNDNYFNFNLNKFKEYLKNENQNIK